MQTKTTADTAVAGIRWNDMGRSLWERLGRPWTRIPANGTRAGDDSAGSLVKLLPWFALALALADSQSRPAPPVRPLPGARHGHRMHTLEGRLVVFGGFAAGNAAADRGAKETWVLDLATGAWKRGGDLPFELAFGSSAVVGGRIVAMGSGIARYDVTADRWDSLAPEGTFPRSHFSAAALGERIYALGGFPETRGGFVGFDLATREVLDPPEPPGFRKGDHFAAVAALGGEIHAVGGIGGEPFAISRAHRVFDGARWRVAAPAPFPLWAKFAAVEALGSRLYVFEKGRGHRYDAAHDRWDSVAGLPLELAMPGACALGGRIAVLGGLATGAERENAALLYDPGADRWEPIPPAGAASHPASLPAR